MDKIICDVCGTSYPETASQCPICGYAKSADTKSVAQGTSGTYHHVKGGRFSSANVRRRNEGKSVGAASVAKSEKTAQVNKGSNFVLGIVAIILLFVFIVVLAFFIIKLAGQLPENGVGSTGASQTDPVQPSTTDPFLTDSTDPSGTDGTDPSATTEPSSNPVEPSAGVNEKWDINRTDFTLRAKGETWDLYSKSSTVAKNSIIWTSDDETVAKVVEGVVEAVGSGNTKVHAEYNGVKKTCKVYCSFEDDEETESTEATGDSSVLRLSDKDGDVTLYTNGSNGEKFFNLYVLDSAGNKKDVVWTASKDGIVTIEGSKITAVEKGTVTITGTCENQTFKCIVRVKTKTN